MLEKLVESWTNHFDHTDRIAELEKTVAIQEAVIASKTEMNQSILNAMAEAAANNSSNIEEPTIKLLPRSEGAPLDPKLLDPFRKYEP